MELHLAFTIYHLADVDVDGWVSGWWGSIPVFCALIAGDLNTSPLWDDFVAKASKLHTCLRAAIQAIAAYLDAFQKIADAATNSRGASKEIGTALTRVCLRHKAVETRLKTFTSAIMDCLVQPLQDKIEDWKRTVATIDKDHAKEYKRCRSELKKRSQRHGAAPEEGPQGPRPTASSPLMDSHNDVTLRRAELKEVEKRSLRAAMVEERLRYCSFVHMLQPVVHEECEVMSELGHLQEAMQSIALVTKEPSVLPQASEELIHDAKASINLYPESPGGGSGSQGGGCSNSLGSRKSSVCSISSMNSSGSSNSPGHHHYPRSLSQASSLHSHPSIDSTSLRSRGQHTHSTSTHDTTSPSSGSSTHQNHYSPLLTNSPTSTAAGTPSGSSISTGTGTGAGLGFVYQVSSPTPPTSEVQVQVLKITEQAGSQPPASAEDTDERSRASVLQKASMFEKQAAAVAAAAGSVSPPVPATGPSPAAAAPSAGGPKRSEAEQQEMDYATSTNIEKTGSIRAKTKAEFLENLNAKLAKQGMSGRAFAVRNLINSKALMYQNPQNLSRPSAQYRRPPTYPNTTTTTSTTATTTTAIGTGTGHCDEQC
ncbi:GL10963 [Drosophila persimilis]|uniref:GL10963 n=1 Tax=Drosophila persimilis TaxID=7234 RepID=B4GCB4_DROPE|nr:GL10963 [Drosophila persimilis]